MWYRRAVTALIAGAALSTLAGCASPAELRRRDEAVCTSYGFAPGSPEFSRCLQSESLARRYDRSLSGGFGGIFMF